METDLRDVTGFRGELITELALTDFSSFEKPLFQPGFLGDKWPAIDFYVELTSVRGSRPYFLAQNKATRSAIGTTDLPISTKRTDIERLLRMPGPTYLFGVHEPSRRVFVRAVHRGTANKAITRIPIKYELTPANLVKLEGEVRDFWKTSHFKPTTSEFS